MPASSETSCIIIRAEGETADGDDNNYNIGNRNGNRPADIAKKRGVQLGVKMPMSMATVANDGRSEIRVVSTDSERSKYGFRERLEKHKNRFIAAEQKAAGTTTTTTALLEVKPNHSVEVGRLEERLAADRKAHQAETAQLRRKTNSEKGQLQLRIAALNQDIGNMKGVEAHWKAKYLQVSAEKDRYVKDVAEGEER